MQIALNLAKQQQTEQKFALRGTGKTWMGFQLVQLLIFPLRYQMERNFVLKGVIKS